MWGTYGIHWVYLQLCYQKYIFQRPFILKIREGIVFNRGAWGDIIVWLVREVDIR